jgi:hypothetical protein
MKVLIEVDPQKASVALAGVDEAAGEHFVSATARITQLRDAHSPHRVYSTLRKVVGV